MTCPHVRAPARVERDQFPLSMESINTLGTLQEEEDREEETEKQLSLVFSSERREIQLQPGDRESDASEPRELTLLLHQDSEERMHYILHHGASDKRREEEEEGEKEKEKEKDLMRRHYRRAEGRERDSYSPTNNGELTQNDVDQYLRLVEETFPFTDEQQVQPLFSSILLDIIEPEKTGAMRTLQGVRSKDLQQYCNNHDNSTKEATQEDLLNETLMQHGFLGPSSVSELESDLFSLTPSAELENHNTALNRKDSLRNSNVNSLHGPPDYTYLLAEDPSEEVCWEINAEDNSSTFNIKLLTHDLVDTMGGSPCSQYTSYSENLSTSYFNFHTRVFTPSSFTPSVEGNNFIQDLQISPSSVFLVDEEYTEDEDCLPSPLNATLDGAAILDEIKLFDLTLEEEFTPEMTAMLQEEGYLDSERAHLETGRDNDKSGSSMVVTEEQSKPRRYQQDVENEADSDSGLSLDLSHSPASLCASKASSYPPPLRVFAEKSPFSEDEYQYTEEGLVGSDVELKGTIKQEDLEEEEMRAVGGVNPKDFKKCFSPNYGSDKLFNSFPWWEHILHDHTYNQPWSSASFTYLRKMSKVQTKSSLRNDNSKPYHHSSSKHFCVTKMLGRDERYAQALRVPFSSELIVNLPVEEFNDLVAHFQLNEEQLTLIRGIRRRGKNKIAAKNCRKRKMDVLQGLRNDVSSLKVYRSGLVQEKQGALRNLQEMKHQLGMLYQEVFSSLNNEEGRLLDPMEYPLHFESNGSVTEASHQQRAVLPLTKKTARNRGTKKKVRRWKGQCKMLQK